MAPEFKAAWCERMRRTFPVGARVRVVDSDEPFYIGVLGTVVGYDAGINHDQEFNDDSPLVTVSFDTPVGCEHDVIARDGFYDDEIVRVA